MSFSPTVCAAIDALARGQLVVVLDNDDHDSEAVLVMAAQFATPAHISFILQHTSGLLCAALPPDRAQQLELPPMIAGATGQDSAFLVSVDARVARNGLSATDRAATCRALASEQTNPGNLNKPGHVLVVQAQPGRTGTDVGHAAAAVDLCRFADLAPVAVFSSLVTRDQFDLLRGVHAKEFAEWHELPVVTVPELTRQHGTAPDHTGGVRELTTAAAAHSI